MSKDVDKSHSADTWISPVDWLRAQLGLPEDAEYSGFGLQRTADGEFLLEVEGGPQWGRDVGRARIFERWQDVLGECGRHEGARIVLYFDAGSHVWVVPAR